MPTPQKSETSTKNLEEGLKCSINPTYFIDQYCFILDAVLSRWIHFTLWPAQAQIIKDLLNHNLLIILKARQLGLTWLMLCWALWLMLFRPVSIILLFSRREEEAKELLKRLTEIYEHLPSFLKTEKVIKDNTLVWELSNGSIAKCFPTTAGDSYSAKFVLADEFDLVENQNDLVTAVKPTIDAGGQFVLLSRVNKKLPQSAFKLIYRAAVEKRNKWHPIFLPWFTRPGRDKLWYEEVCSDAITRTGSLDSVHEQYPENEEEALSGNSLDSRIPKLWLDNCYQKEVPTYEMGNHNKDSLLYRITRKVPAVPNLLIFRPPTQSHIYIIGADTAEGNPTSDPTAVNIIDRHNGEQVAVSSGPFDPKTFGRYLVWLSRFYNNAPVLIERNNHGHAVIISYDFEATKDINGNDLGSYWAGPLLKGKDGKVGWQESSVTKALLFDILCEVLREEHAIIHHQNTYLELMMIEGATNKAPEGEHDDLAISYALAIVGRMQYRLINSAVTSKRPKKDNDLRIPGYSERSGLNHVYGD